MRNIEIKENGKLEETPLLHYLYKETIPND